MVKNNTSATLAAISGLLAVILGAFGAHALHKTLEAGQMLDAWRTAVSYQTTHSIAALCLSLIALDSSRICPKLLDRAVKCWLSGVLLFSGSIYGLALGGPRWLGPITPLGGLCLMTGWCLVIVALWKNTGREPSR